MIIIDLLLYFSFDWVWLACTLGSILNVIIADLNLDLDIQHNAPHAVIVMTVYEDAGSCTLTVAPAALQSALARGATRSTSAAVFSALRSSDAIDIAVALAASRQA